MLELEILNRDRFFSDPHPTQCCSNDGRETSAAVSNPSCFNILIPSEDPLSKKFGQTCMNFVRTTTDQDNGCAPPSQPAEQVRNPLLKINYGENFPYCDQRM